MSGTTQFGFGPTTPMPLNPQGWLGNGNLLQSNTTLLQPVSGFHTLFNALWLLMLSSATAAPAIAELDANTLSTDISLANDITVLQQQIDAIHARLANAGIG